MESRERRTLYLPRDVDERIADLAARGGHSFAAQARAMLIDAVEQKRGNGLQPTLGFARLEERVDPLETLLRELLRTSRVRGKLKIQLLAGLRAVLQELAEGSIEQRCSYTTPVGTTPSAPSDAAYIDSQASVCRSLTVDDVSSLRASMLDADWSDRATCGGSQIEAAAPFRGLRGRGGAS